MTPSQSKIKVSTWSKSCPWGSESLGTLACRGLVAEANARRLEEEEERLAATPEAAPEDGLTPKAAVLESRQVNMTVEAANFIVAYIYICLL
jgi:hypothetical protein